MCVYIYIYIAIYNQSLKLPKFLPFSLCTHYTAWFHSKSNISYQIHLINVIASVSPTGESNEDHRRRIQKTFLLQRVEKGHV